MKWWLRQNIVLFVHKDMLWANEALSRAASEHRGPISIVHPDIYLSRLQDLASELNQFQQLDAFLRAGGVFRTSVTADGQINVVQIAKP